MNFEELLDYLDLEEAGQFEYFEALADLVECEEPIEMEAIYKLFEGADKETVATLLEDYFEDVLDGLPENAGEIYSLLHQIKLSLVGMVTNIEDENDLRKFSPQLVFPRIRGGAESGKWWWRYVVRAAGCHHCISSGKAGWRAVSIRLRIRTGLSPGQLYDVFCRSGC